MATADCLVHTEGGLESCQIRVARDLGLASQMAGGHHQVTNHQMWVRMEVFEPARSRSAVHTGNSKHWASPTDISVPCWGVDTSDTIDTYITQLQRQTPSGFGIVIWKS